MVPRVTNTARKRSTDIPVTRGSGNVYADLGFDNPAEELAKAQLAMMIDAVIQERGLTQQAAATLMGQFAYRLLHTRSHRVHCQ